MLKDIQVDVIIGYNHVVHIRRQCPMSREKGMCQTLQATSSLSLGNVVYTFSLFLGMRVFIILLRYERVYLPLCKVADTPFHI